MSWLISRMLKDKTGRISLAKIALVSALTILLLAAMFYYLPKHEPQAAPIELVYRHRNALFSAITTPQLRLPDSDMRKGLEVFIVGSNINEVKVIHSEQMKGIIGEQAKTLQLRQVFNNDMLGRFYNA